MSSAQIAIALYLLPGLAIVAWNFGSTMTRVGHNRTRVIVLGVTLAILTWPVLLFFPRRREP